MDRPYAAAEMCLQLANPLSPETLARDQLIHSLSPALAASCTSTCCSSTRPSWNHERQTQRWTWFQAVQPSSFQTHSASFIFTKQHTQVLSTAILPGSKLCKSGIMGLIKIKVKLCLNSASFFIYRHERDDYQCFFSNVFLAMVSLFN